MVDTVKVAVLAPAATVTEAGTVATEVSPLSKLTTRPPGGAIPERVSVAVTAFPPTTGFGLKARVFGKAGVTVRFWLRLTPRAEAPMLATWEDDTP